MADISMSVLVACAPALALVLGDVWQHMAGPVGGEEADDEAEEEHHDDHDAAAACAALLHLFNPPDVGNHRVVSVLNKREKRKKNIEGG